MFVSTHCQNARLLRAEGDSSLVRSFGVRTAVLLRPGTDGSTLADLDHGGALPDGLRHPVDSY